MASCAACRRRSISTPSAPCRRCSSTCADAAADCDRRTTVRTAAWRSTLAECCFDTGGIGARSSIVAADGRRTTRSTVRPRCSVNRPRESWCRRRPKTSPRCWSARRRRECRRASSGRTGGNRLRIAVGGHVAIDRVGRRGRASVGDGARSVLRQTRGLKMVPDGSVHLPPRKHARQVQGRMRRLRHLRSSRSGEHDLPGSLRAAAPRAGERRHRRVRRRDRCGCRGRWATSPTSSTPRRWPACPGTRAIGHVRYSTAGSSQLLNAQPILIDCAHGQIAIGHNGNLVNAQELRDELVRQGSIFQSNSDTEVVLHLYARSKARDGRGCDRRIGVAGAGRVFVRAADEGPADRGPRSARVPAARARPARRRDASSARKPARWI